MIGQIIGGLIVGVIARLIMPGKEAFPDGIVGWILTALLGMVGAVIGGYIARTFWAGENYTAGWIMSILGAIVLLFIVRLLFGTRNTMT
ncbi:MAG TPA: GlsB/YeaQ/YmgE family stress response membrane protein [Pyrinomonadaceae bacterium]|nr:GlsB/YeaQ/YmgE family stress response membrane protein [Pyrinomonadaceae bacterium]